YIIKTSVGLGVAWLFYFVLLKRLTLYVCNRFFLLSFSILALFIPLLRLDFFVAQQNINASPLINSIPSINIYKAGNIFIPEENSGNAWYMLLALFVSGVIICSLRFFMQLRSFKKIRAAARFIDKKEGIKLYHLDMDIIPFSFHDSIYVNKLR